MTIVHSRRLTILLGVHQFFPEYRTGTEVLTLELARGLRARGHNVEILTGAPEANNSAVSTPWLIKDEYDGFIVHRLHYVFDHHSSDDIRLHVSAPDRVYLIAELVKKIKCEIVHFNHIMGFSAEVIKGVHLLGVPVIYTPTDFWAICPQTTLFRKHEEKVCDGPTDFANCVCCFKAIPKLTANLRLMLGKTPLWKINDKLAKWNSFQKRIGLMVEYVNVAKAILPATQFMADILQRYGVSANLVKVIEYGVDIGELPEKLPVPLSFDDNNPLVLGFIGAIFKLKGLHVILQALTHRSLKNIILYVYGKIDPADPYCRQILEMSSHLGGRVKFEGSFPHEKIGEVLRRIHLLIVPSLWYESAPLVLCSALAAGTPVLVSRLGGMTEVIREGINGFSFQAGDSLELTKTISNILGKPELLVKMQNNTYIWKRRTSHYADDIEAVYYSKLPGELIRGLA